MELFQLFWDEQKKLVLEFKKNEDEKRVFLPETIKNLTIQFEISKFINQEPFQNQPPHLVAIKKLYHSHNSLSFSIELDEMVSSTDLQIKILRLTVFLFSGQRVEYYFSETYKITDIWVNEDCYDGFKYEELGSKKIITSKITQEKLFQEIQTSIHEITEKKTLIYEKSKIDRYDKNNSLVLLISENNKTLSRIEQVLKNLSLSLHQTQLNTNQYFPSAPITQRSDLEIVRINKPTRPTLIQGQMTSSKIMVIREMKSIFSVNREKNSDFNIKDILKPLTEVELNKIILNDAALKKREEEAIKNQIKRFKKHQEKELQLENLKPPK